MRRSTAIYIFVLALLAGLYYLLNNRPETIDAETTAEPIPQTEYLFSPSDGLPTQILVKTRALQLAQQA